MKKFIQISLALLTGLTAAVAIMLKSDLVSNNLLQRIKAVAWIELGQELEVAELEVSLIPLGLEVRGVVITDQATPEAWLNIGALDLSLGWNFSTSQPKIRFASVRTVKLSHLPEINRGPYPSAHDFGGEPASERQESVNAKADFTMPKLGDFIDYIELLDLNLHLSIEDQEVAVGDFDILARATSPTSWQLGLKANRVTTRGHLNLQNAGLNGSSFVTIAENEFKVALMGFTVETLTHSVGLQGQWAFNAPIPTDNRLEIKLDGNLEGLRSLTPRIDLGDLSGKITLDGEITGELASPQYSWTLGVQELNSHKLTIGDLRASGSGDLDVVKISNLQVRGEMGAIDGEASIRFDDKQIETQLQTERLQVGDLLALLNAPRAVNGPFTGKTSVIGKLSPLSLGIKLDGYFESLEVNDGDSLDIVELKNLATNITATIDEKTIDIRKARLSEPSLDIETFGEIFLTSPVELNLTSNVKRINLKPLSPIVGLSFDGNGQAALSVDGPVDDITVSGSAHLKGFALEGLKFGTFRSAVLFKENQIELPNLTLLRGEGVARGKVIVDIVEPSLDANLDFEEIQINPLLDDLKLAPELLPYVKGRATGNVTLSGPIAELGLTVSASGKDVSFDPLYLPQAHIEAVRVTGPDSPMIFGILAGEQEENVINVEVSSTGNLAIDLKLEDYPFANLIIPSLKNRLGRVNLSADLDGPIDGLNGRVTLATSECRIDTIDLGDGRGDLLFNNGQFKGNLSFPANAIEATASGQVGDKIPVSTTIQFANLEPLRWVDPTTEIGLKTTGSVFIQGDLTDLPALTADANLTAAALNWQGINGTLERAAVISYASEKFRVAELDMNLDGLLVSAMGEVPLEGSQSLQLRVLGNAGGLRPLFGSVESLSGDIDGFIDISGEIAEPQFSGSLTMRDISGKEPTLGLRFTDGVGRMTLIDRDLLIDSATLKTGDGTISVLGKITFLPEFQPQLQLTLNQAKLKPYPSSEAIVSGELQVSQPRGILVSGALEVNRATYGENVDLSRLFVRQPNMSFGTNIEEEPWDLRVQLSAPQGIFVSNNMVEAELRADLTVRGNTKRMGLIGSVVPLNGTVSYGGNEFEVESGSFDFTDEYAIRPNYATKLRADACGMDLQVNLSGEAERFIVEASGEDETGIVDARDALLCAQFGIRSAEPNLTADQQGSGLKDSLPGAVDALWRVSGMDERVRRYLPVVDEFKLTSGYSRSSKQTEPRLLVIKELGRQWELKYNGPVNETDEQHVLGLEYRLKRGLVLEGSWVSVSEATAGDLGIDLRMDWEFD